jgi:hypothetical protein
MKAILILAASLFCFFTAKADDDYPTIVRYLGENGHYIISPDEVAKVQAYMKAHGYQHVSEMPKGDAGRGTEEAVAAVWRMAHLLIQRNEHLSFSFDRRPCCFFYSLLLTYHN